MSGDAETAPRLSAIGVLGALLLAAVFGFHRIAELDLFEQVAVGRAILSEPSSLGTSSFHQGYPRYPYVEDKWLTSVLAALAERLAGESGLMLYQIGLAGLVGLAWFVSFHAWGGDQRVALLATALSLAACSFRIEPRPESFSLALLATLVALFATRVPFRRMLWLVALLSTLWIQLHGYFVIGLLVLAAAACETLLGGRAGPLQWNVGRGRATGRAMLLLGAALLACLVHPQGTAALFSPIEELDMLRRFPYFRQAIQEFQPSTALFEGFGAVRWALLVGTGAASLLLDRLLSGRRSTTKSLVGLLATTPWILVPPDGLLPWPYRLTFALFVAAIFEVPGHLRSRRLLPVFLLGGFAILALPLIRNASLLPPAALLLLVPGWSRTLRENDGSRLRTVAIAFGGCVVVLIVWARLADRLVPGSDQYPSLTGWGVEHRVVPGNAVDFLVAEGLPDRLLNHFDIGGYLLYRLHPRSSVFVAGNTSMYPPEFFREYHREVLGRDASVENLTSRYGVRTAVLGLASAEIEILAGKLARSPAWCLVFLDRSAAVFVHVEENSRDLVERLTVDLDRRVPTLARGGFDRSPLPSWFGASRRPHEALRLGRFLRIVGRGDLAIAVVLADWNGAGPDTRLAAFLAEAADEVALASRVVAPLEWLLSRAGATGSLEARLARARYVRGVESLAGGDLAGAEADFYRARELVPHEPGPWLALARLEIERKDLPRARTLLLEALKRTGQGPGREVLREDPALLGLVEVESGGPAPETLD